MSTCSPMIAPAEASSVRSIRSTRRLSSTEALQRAGSAPRSGPGGRAPLPNRGREWKRDFFLSARRRVGDAIAGDDARDGERLECTAPRAGDKGRTRASASTRRSTTALLVLGSSAVGKWHAGRHAPRGASARLGARHGSVKGRLLGVCVFRRRGTRRRPIEMAPRVRALPGRGPKTRRAREANADVGQRDERRRDAALSRRARTATTPSRGAKLIEKDADNFAARRITTRRDARDSRAVPERATPASRNCFDREGRRRRPGG